MSFVAEMAGFPGYPSSNYDMKPKKGLMLMGSVIDITSSSDDEEEKPIIQQNRNIVNAKRLIDIPSSSDEEEVEEPIIQQNRNIVNAERLIYQAALQDMNQPKKEKDLPPGVLTVSLMRHQKIALEWMRQKEKRSLNCLGGILADDQGLGKTISTIALILFHKLKSESSVHKKKQRSRKSGGTLIVCPASVVKQWAREIDEKVSDEHKLSVLVYHGKRRCNNPIELAKYDVVVTTYAIVTNEVPPNPLVDYYDGKISKESVIGKDGSSNLYSGALARVRWLRVVLDEAQTIKNYKTQAARTCSSLKAKRRWCLSGTPIQNEIFDLYSYFKFLRYHPYAMYKSFCQTITGPLSKNPTKGYKKLQAILRAILLRRTKGTLLDGQPILTLPPKIINLNKIDLSDKEMSFYRRLETDSQIQFEEYAAAGTLRQNYAHILVLLLRLRQACCHPHLVAKCEEEVESFIKNEDNDKIPVVQSRFISTKIKAAIEILLSNAKQDTSSTPNSSSSKSALIKTIVFSQWTGMLDLVENSLEKNGLTFRRLDGSMSLGTRDRAVKEFNKDPSVQVMLMSLKAGNLGLNMVSASQVVLLDLWWNPTTEDQAVDRAHRIGQTRAVTVTRITTKNTIEERILALQENKRKIVASAFGEDHGGVPATQLTIEDLEYLFYGF